MHRILSEKSVSAAGVSRDVTKSSAQNQRVLFWNCGTPAGRNKTPPLPLAKYRTSARLFVHFVRRSRSSRNKIHRRPLMYHRCCVGLPTPAPPANTIMRGSANSQFGSFSQSGSFQSDNAMCDVQTLIQTDVMQRAIGLGPQVAFILRHWRPPAPIGRVESAADRDQRLATSQNTSNL